MSWQTAVSQVYVRMTIELMSSVLRWISARYGCSNACVCVCGCVCVCLCSYRRLKMQRVTWLRRVVQTGRWPTLHVLNAITRLLLLLLLRRLLLQLWRHGSALAAVCSTSVSLTGFMSSLAAVTLPQRQQAAVNQTLTPVVQLCCFLLLSRLNSTSTDDCRGFIAALCSFTASCVIYFHAISDQFHCRYSIDIGP